MSIQTQFEDAWLGFPNMLSAALKCSSTVNPSPSLCVRGCIYACLSWIAFLFLTLLCVPFTRWTFTKWEGYKCKGSGRPGNTLETTAWYGLAAGNFLFSFHSYEHPINPLFTQVMSNPVKCAYLSVHCGWKLLCITSYFQLQGNRKLMISLFKFYDKTRRICIFLRKRYHIPPWYFQLSSETHLEGLF